MYKGGKKCFILFSNLKILLFILVLEIDLFFYTSIHFSFRNVILYMFLI